MSTQEIIVSLFFGQTLGYTMKVNAIKVTLGNYGNLQVRTFTQQSSHQCISRCEEMEVNQIPKAERPQIKRYCEFPGSSLA